MGKMLEYDAEMVEDEPNRSIGWKSRNGDIGNSGNVTFADMGDGETLVHVALQWFDPPGGLVGEAAAHIFQNPEEMLDEDLLNFKHLVEGEGGAERGRRVA